MVAIDQFKKGLKHLDLKDLDIKLKKHKSTKLVNFTYILRNHLYALTDTDLKIIDLSTGEINSDKKLYRIWDPQGYKFHICREKEKTELCYIDRNGLVIIDLNHYLIYEVDDLVRGQCLTQIGGVNTQKLLKYYLRVENPEHQAPEFNIDEGKTEVATAVNTAGSYLTDGFGVSLFAILRIGYGKIRTVKVLTLRNLEGFDPSGIGMSYIEYHKLVYIFLKNKKSRDRCQIRVFNVKTRRIVRIWNIADMDFSFDAIKIKKGKLILRSNTEIFLLNILKSKTKYIPCSPSETAFFTKSKDYAATPSKRVRFRHGLTFLKTDFQRFQNPSPDYPSIGYRLKNGDFVITQDHYSLRFIYNVTKNRLIQILRVDHCSEVPSYFSQGIVNATPNINLLKKFYLKRFNVENKSVDFVYHKFFKKMTKGFYKRFENIHSIPGTPRMYFEAHRLFDTRIYNKSKRFRESEEYKRLYDCLYCIEYNYLTTKTVIYDLPVSSERTFRVIGEDSCSKSVYLIDSEATLIKLETIDQKVELIDYSSYGAKEDRFGEFNDWSVEFNYLVHDSKIFFKNFTGLVIMYDLEDQSRRAIFENVENPRMTILHLDRITNQVSIYENTNSIQVFNIESQELWEYDLEQRLIPYISDMDQESLKMNYVQTFKKKLTLITGETIKIVYFNDRESVRVEEIQLMVHTDHFQSETILMNQKYYLVVSGECLLDLVQGKYVKFSFEDQFHFLYKMKNIDIDKLERLYRIAMKFKQSAFVLFEHKLNFSKVLCQLDMTDIFLPYIKAICYVTLSRGVELNANDYCYEMKNEANDLGAIWETLSQAPALK